MWYYLSKNLGLRESVFFRRLHIRFHCEGQFIQHPTRHKKVIFDALRILMRSFPWPICDSTASSPSWSAFFLASRIPTEVLWKTSIISLSSCKFFQGTMSTRNLRNLGDPILTAHGKIYVRERYIRNTVGLPKLDTD